MLTFGVRFYSNGNILGYILPNSPFAKVAVLLALTVLFLSICCDVINIINLLPVYNSTLQNALTQSHLVLFGISCFITVVMLILLLFFNTCMLICVVVFVTRDVSALFGKLQMVYYRGTLLVWLF